MSSKKLNGNTSDRQYEDKRPWLSVVGLLIGIIAWISIFALPATDSFDTLFLELYIMMAIAAVAFIMSFLGRRTARSFSIVGMIVAGALLFFLIIALIGSTVVDNL